MTRILIIIGVVLAALSTATWFGYSAGFNACDAQQKKAVLESLDDDRKKAEEVIVFKEKLKVVYRDKIKIVKAAKDPTGCLDVKLNSLGLDGLFNKP